MDEAEQDGRGGTPRAGFFQVTLNELKRIAAEGGNHKEMAAYLVLCSGVSGKHRVRYCTHGASSISKRAGIGYRVAEQAIEWLLEHGFIRKPAEGEPGHMGKSASRGLIVRWVIVDEQPDVAICRQFTDGVREGVKSPLQHLLTDIDGTEDILRSRAVMDALLLFAAMMKEQDFGEWAGVNPAVWHQPFVPVEVGEGDDFSEHITPVNGSNGVLVTVKQAEVLYGNTDFMRQAIGTEGDSDAALAARFWHAAEGLRRGRLAYRVMVIWSGNPTLPAGRRHAEPMATLYVNDRWARTYDPQVQFDVNRAVWRTGTVGNEDFDEEGSPVYAYTDRYRYIVKAGQESKTNLIGQLRVRYWPATEAVVGGRVIEQRRTARWQQSLDALGRA